MTGRPGSEVSNCDDVESTKVNGGLYIARLARRLLLIILTASALLTASPVAAQCDPNDLLGCDGSPTTGPDIGISPDGGSWTVDSGSSAVVPVWIYMSDSDGLNALSRDVRLWSGSSNEPLALNYTEGEDGRTGTLHGDVQLVKGGENILVAQISDKYGNTSTVTATYHLNFTVPGRPVVSLEPHHSEYRNTALGAFTVGYAAPAYTSMDAARSVGLVYNSEQARITGFVQVDARPDAANAADVVAMSLRIERWAPDPDGTHPLIGRESFYAKGDGGFQRLAVHWLLGDNTATGAYKYWAVVRAYTSSTAWMETRNLVRVLVVNQKASRYGAGWSLAGVQRLHPTADGLLLDEGNGIARFFRDPSNGACAGGSCTYETPAGDFTVLKYRAETKDFARTYPDGSQVIFNEPGLMVSARDRFGNSTNYEWQNGGGPMLVTRIIDPVGQAISLEYVNGYLGSITAAGRQVTFAYNAANQLTSISGPPNLQATYNASHQLLTYTTNFTTTSYTDPGATSELTYDDFRQLRTFKAAAVIASGTLQQPKTSYKSLPSRTAPSPNTTYSVTSPAAAVPTSAASILITDPRTHYTQVSIDRYGNATKVIDGEGLTTVATYTSDGLPASVSTPTSYSAYGWNEKGQPLLQTVAGSTVYEASYNAQSLPEFVASGGTALWYAYGAEGQLVRSWPGKKEDELLTGTTYTYNSRYQLIKTVGPKGETTEWSYEGNPWRNVDYARVTRPDGLILTTSTTYDTRSRTRTITNPLQQTATMEYDDFNRPIKQIDPRGGWTVYEYTGAHLTKVTDPGLRTFTFTFNALGWLESERFPGDGTSRKYTYNADGLVLSVTDRRGQQVTFTYDGIHRLRDRTADGLTTTFRHPDPHTTVVSNNESVVTTSLINGVGTLGAVSSALAGRVFQIKRVVDTNKAWRDIGFDLNTFVNDALQRTDPVRYHTDFNPADTSLSSTYQIEDMSGARTTMAFDVSGRPVRVAFPGVTQYNAFTVDGRLESTSFGSATPNQRLGATFVYDVLGRLSTRTSLQENRRWEYEYDNLGRVTQYEKYQKNLHGEMLRVAAEQYTYDPSGNRTDSGAFMELGSNRYTDFKGFAFAYDAEGNLTRKSKSGFEQTYTWNALGQLTSVTTNGTTVTYGYDGLGARVRRTQDGSSRYYVYDGDDLLLETDHYGNATQMYTHWPGVDNPHSVRVTSGGQNYLYYYVTERPGHVTGLLNTAGGVAGEHHYKPFGEVESASDDAGQPLRFMARELDFTTGLYFVRNRWYDPAIARFVSQDPIGAEGGLNTYAYVGNDPVNGRDPSGLQSTQDTDPIVLDPVITGCERLWSWGWDNCYSNYIFDMWAKQRHEQDTYDFGIGARPIVSPDSSPSLLRVLEESEAQTRRDRIIQAERRAERAQCRAEPRQPASRGMEHFHNAKWAVGGAIVGTVAGSFFGPAGTIAGRFVGAKAGVWVGPIVGALIGAAVETEGNRILQKCGPGVL